MRFRNLSLFSRQYGRSNTERLVRKGRFIGLVSALFITLTVISACAKVPMPRSDSTPPQLHWVVVDGSTGERITTNFEDPFSKVEVRDYAAVSLVAKDAEGVKRIKLWDPAMGYTCAKGSVEQASGPGLSGTYQEQILGPDQNGYVLTELILLKSTYFNFSCNPGWVLVGSNATFEGEAENYFNGVTKSSLMLVSKP